MFVAALTLFGLALSFFVPERSPSYLRYQFDLNQTPSTLAEDITLLEARVKRDPEGALDLAALGELYAAEGKASGDLVFFTKAEAAAKQSLRNRSADNATALLVLADSAQARHQFTKAISLAEKILKDRPGAPDVLPVLVTSHLALGGLTDADKESRLLVEVGRQASAYALRGLVLEAQGRDREAEFYFEKALEGDELGDLRGAAFHRALLGRYYLAHGDKRKAKMLIAEALRIQPGEPTALGLRARYSEEIGDYFAAATAFREAFEKSRQLAFLLGEARTLLLAGKAEGAALRDQGEALLRQELADAGGIGHRSELIRLLLERATKKDLLEAKSLALLEIRDRPSAESFHLLAWAEWKSGNYLPAREAIARSLESGVHRAEIYLHASSIEAALKNEKLAGTYLQMGAELSANPHFADEARPRLEEAALTQRKLAIR